MISHPKISFMEMLKQNRLRSVWDWKTENNLSNGGVVLFSYWLYWFSCHQLWNKPCSWVSIPSNTPCKITLSLKYVFTKRRLLTAYSNSIRHVWEMTTYCIFSWHWKLANVDNSGCCKEVEHKYFFLPAFLEDREEDLTENTSEIVGIQSCFCWL